MKRVGSLLGLMLGSGLIPVKNVEWSWAPQPEYVSSTGVRIWATSEDGKIHRFPSKPMLGVESGF